MNQRIVKLYKLFPFRDSDFLIRHFQFPCRISTHLFLRLLALVYLIAFASLWPQIHGLIGSEGILPLPETLTLIKERLGYSGIWQFPMLFYIASSDTALSIACAGGILLAITVLFLPGLWPGWFLLWAGYLSLSTAGRDFLSFQWDALLLETGFLTLFLIPLRSTPTHTPEPPALTANLYRWLLFRLIFASGVVKLTSGDPTWRDLTALTYHYQTQPLPNPIAWYVHQLPDTMQQLSCAGVLFIELLVPFFIFAPRKVRHIAGILLIALQLLITATGNYTFFNLLTIALCLWLFDDSFWPARLKNHLLFTPRRTRRHIHRILIPFATLVLLLSMYLFTRSTLRTQPSWPKAVTSLYATLAPFHVVNSYGLFASMTTERPEIILEGSEDGITWQAYEFDYKAGDLAHSLPIVAPHQPRLDWQMWFAALRTARQTPWFIQFCQRILEGSPSVHNLLAHNPFPDVPPPYFRAQLYLYEFTTPHERSQTGQIWKRTLKGSYLPAVRNPFLSP